MGKMCSLYFKETAVSNISDLDNLSMEVYAQYGMVLRHRKDLQKNTWVELKLEMCGGKGRAKLIPSV